jgi:hypothetical protein
VRGKVVKKVCRDCHCEYETDNGKSRFVHCPKCNLHALRQNAEITITGLHFSVKLTTKEANQLAQSFRGMSKIFNGCFSSGDMSSFSGLFNEAMNRQEREGYLKDLLYVCGYETKIFKEA